MGDDDMRVRHSVVGDDMGRKSDPYSYHNTHHDTHGDVVVVS